MSIDGIALMTFKLNVPYTDIIGKEQSTPYMPLSRLDILCGFKWKNLVFPCRICGVDTCEGESEECKNEGAYTLGVRCID